jgi:hypothetical protein
MANTVRMTSITAIISIKVNPPRPTVGVIIGPHLEDGIQ